MHRGKVDPKVRELLRGNELSQDHVNRPSALYKIALTGIPHVLAFNNAADLWKWPERFVKSMPLSADNDFYKLSKISFLVTLRGST